MNTTVLRIGLIVFYFSLLAFIIFHGAKVIEMKRKAGLYDDLAIASTFSPAEVVINGKIFTIIESY